MDNFGWTQTDSGNWHPPSEEERVEQTREWMREHTTQQPSVWTRSRELYNEMRKEFGEESDMKLARWLQQAGFYKSRTRVGVVWSGIALRKTGGGG